MTLSPRLYDLFVGAAVEFLLNLVGREGRLLECFVVVYENIGVSTLFLFIMFIGYYFIISLYRKYSLLITHEPSTCVSFQ